MAVIEEARVAAKRLAVQNATSPQLALALSQILPLIPDIVLDAALLAVAQVCGWILSTYKVNPQSSGTFFKRTSVSY